jgi:hypothetical protein
MKNTKSISLVVICFLVFMTALTGCSSSSTTPSSGTQEEKTVTLKLGHIRPADSPADKECQGL